LKITSRIDTHADRELVWMAGMASAIMGFLGLGNPVYYFLARNRVPQDDAKTR
jgi:hypothetical protein